MKSAPATQASGERWLSLLLVEDDVRFAELTARYLEDQGIAVMHAGDGPTAIAEASRTPYDVVLLDLMLPGCDGMQVCRQLRQRQDVPVIMVTARDGEADRVSGLEVGADDYIVKPFSARELVARIRAVLRRYRGHSGPVSDQVLRVGALVLEPGSLRATLDGQPLSLTAYEFALLRALAERAGRVLNREQLLDLAKGSADDVFDRSIDVNVSRLRRKLGDDPRNPRLLKTVRGAGYMLATSSSE